MSVVPGTAVAAVATAPGWYGKVAMLGDFAQRRLSPEFVQRIDAWLANWVVASRRQLGERWLDLYLTAPLLRFAWAPGVVDNAWWFGVLMPSCDSSGRYFPLLVAQARARAPVDRGELDHLQTWFDHVAAAATCTLDEPASFEAFEAALADAPAWPDAASVTASFPLSDRLDPRGSRQHWAEVIASAGSAARLAGTSIWWLQMDPSDDSITTLLAALPTADRVTALLFGHEPDG